MRRPGPARPHVHRSAFRVFRFPPEVITVAVRWYLRYGGLLRPSSLAVWVGAG